MVTWCRGEIVGICVRNARSTLDPTYDEGCPHRVADKSNCDLRPE